LPISRRSSLRWRDRVSHTSENKRLLFFARLRNKWWATCFSAFPEILEDRVEAEKTERGFSFLISKYPPKLFVVDRKLAILSRNLMQSCLSRSRLGNEIMEFASVERVPAKKVGAGW
jgi:hypothetical protein